MPVETFRERIRTICLDPLRVDLPVENFEARRQAFERLLEDQLGRAGFGVVGADRVGENWTSVLAREGGFFDPHTGWRNEERYREIRALAMVDLKRELGCDALLTPSLTPVTAPFFNGTIEWDGLSQHYPGTSNASGWVAALSLHVVLSDMSDEEIMFLAGGIAPLADFNAGFFSSKFEPIDDAQLLADEFVNLHAIHLALQPILPSSFFPTPTPFDPMGRLEHRSRNPLDMDYDEPTATPTAPPGG